MSKLTFERATELLQYNPDTGKIYWRISPNSKAKAGDESGRLWQSRRNTYRQIRVDDKLYLVHRIAWLLHYKKWPENQIDHIDGDWTNNRVKSLRDVTHQENGRNRRMHRDNSSGRAGVCWHKKGGKWRAQIGINGKRKYLGHFDSIDEAAAAYRKAADEIGFTERHGRKDHE